MPNELILIVEDNEKNRKLVRDVLQVKGYTTIESETAEEGIKLALDKSPALILMDIPGDRRDYGAEAAPGRAENKGDTRHRDYGVGHDSQQTDDVG